MVAGAAAPEGEHPRADTSRSPAQGRLQLSKGRASLKWEQQVQGPWGRSMLGASGVWKVGWEAAPRTVRKRSALASILKGRPRPSGIRGSQQGIGAG